MEHGSLALQDALSPSMLQLSGILVLRLRMEQGRTAESLASDQKHKCIQYESITFPPAHLPELETTGNHLKAVSGSKALTTIDKKVEPSVRSI